MLGAAKDAKRTFDQIQLTLERRERAWQAAASLVWTDLRGNFFSVSGYDNPIGIRITSYNVCYTKLLRSFSPEFLAATPRLNIAAAVSNESFTSVCVLRPNTSRASLMIESAWENFPSPI